jgi:hypothetical protein
LQWQEQLQVAGAVASCRSREEIVAVAGAVASCRSREEIVAVADYKLGAVAGKR